MRLVYRKNRCCLLEVEKIVLNQNYERSSMQLIRISFIKIVCIKTALKQPACISLTTVAKGLQSELQNEPIFVYLPSFDWFKDIIVELRNGT